MNKYNNVIYDGYRVIISRLINANKGDNFVYFAGDENDQKLEEFLKRMSLIYGFQLTKEEWLELCEIEINEHLLTKEVKTVDGVIFSSNEVNRFEISQDKDSTWQRFKKKSLKEKNKFDDATIMNIENDVLQIIRNLSIQTPKKTPMKGLVIGGVQSGKTTNIAALMAMASDMGFNLFIVLSGMIESLRVQTESRMMELLNPTSGKKIVWQEVGNDKGYINNSLQQKFKGNHCIFTIVLKQKSRLENLIKWLHQDKKIAEKLKVLIIDDESDQAGVNTSKDPEYERKTINRLIVNLVHGKGIKGKDSVSNIKAINYIGYTATPYANILSESPDNPNSLYPKNFISVLTKSNRHFGPSEIFGEMGSENEGINIVREINEPIKVKDLSEKLEKSLPIELKESLAYFISASASLRKHNFGKPVSMLVQVSHRIDDHSLLNDKILYWLTNNKDEVIELTKKIWNEELDLLKVEDFKNKVYIDSGKYLKKHKYEEIEEIIENLLNIIKPIGKDISTNRLIYHEGIHLVIDNSDNSQSRRNIEKRLHYPTNKADNEMTPVFLIIGGDTLSRGLTLEGLISTYFLRTPSAADTLTQMGRWFGYRINYELYPRVWMTNKTKMQFEYIATLEKELREEIIEMQRLGSNPEEVGPRIKHLPQYISVTSKNKSHAMTPAEYNFSGYSSQTYIFEDDYNIQKENLKLGEEFINRLGKPIIVEDDRRDNVYWENIPFKLIKEDLLVKFNFNERIKSFNNIQILFDWIEKATVDKKLENWNIIIGSLGKANSPDNNWKLKNFSFNMVNRTKRNNSLKGEINIGVLRGPRDLFNDVNPMKLNGFEKKLLEKAIKSGKRIDYNNFRNAIGSGKIPQLILYKIDKNSKPRNLKSRIELDIDTDLFGIYISIPGGEKNNYTTYITVKIDNIPDIGLEDSETNE